MTRNTDILLCVSRCLNVKTDVLVVFRNRIHSDNFAKININVRLHAYFSSI
jgi:hypothetical protein